jgi:5-methylcytosine-specific restriction endonuclease McrA
MSKHMRPWNGMNWIRQEKRLAIYLRDDLACTWCGAGIEDDEVACLTLDHLIPHSRGGTNEARNLVTSCKRCNSARGNRGMTEFASAVSGYIDQESTRDILLRIRRNRSRVLPLSQAKQMLRRRKMTE